MDTAFSSIPIFNYLKNNGNDVYVMGNRPSDPLAIMANSKWINQDYSQIDQVKKICSDYFFDYIIPGCTDLSIEVCQAISENSSYFDNPNVYVNIGNKDLFRDMCEKLNLPSPIRKKISDFPLSGYYICKPVDSFSGKGITVFDGMDIKALTHADRVARDASNTGCSILETFSEGQLYSYSAFIEKKKVVDSFIVLEGSSSNPYAVDTSYVVKDFRVDIEDILKNSIESISSHLDLCDGLVHLQFILSGDKPYLIEMTRRCPGDLYSKLIEYSTGFDYAGKYASYFLGERYDTFKSEDHSIVRHTVSSLETKDYLGLDFIDSISVKAIYPLLPLGSAVVKNQKTRVAILFLDCDKKMMFDKLIERDLYKI